jgi:hypothetical protein
MRTEKWGKPYSEVWGYVNARRSIAIVCATHLCVSGSRIPAAATSAGLSRLFVGIWGQPRQAQSLLLPTPRLSLGSNLVERYLPRLPGEVSQLTASHHDLEIHAGKQCLGGFQTVLGHN